MEDDYKIDEVILLVNEGNKGQSGTIRYKGAIGTTAGIWFGIELQNAQGKHNGSSKGVQYFKCKENHGIFVRVNHIQKIKNEDKKQPPQNSDDNSVRIIQELKTKIAELEKAGGSDQIIENLSIKNEDLQNSNELLQLELEECQEEISNLKKQLLNFSNSQGDAAQLQRMTQAFKLLQEKYDKEKIETQQTLERYKAALNKVPELQNQIKESQQLGQEFQRKNNEVEELKNRLDEAKDSEKMMEMLSGKLFIQEEQISELKSQLQIIQQERNVDGELLQEQEDFNKELQMEIINKETLIESLKMSIQSNAQKFQEYEVAIMKFREKISLLLKEKELLSEQTNEGIESTDKLDKIQDLLVKQSKLNQQRRETYGKSIEQYLKNLEFQNEIQIGNTFLFGLPDNFLQKLPLAQVRSYLMLKNLSQKSQFLFDELQFKYLQNNSENIELIPWVSQLLIYLSDINLITNNFMQCLQLYDNQKFNDIIKSNVVNYFVQVL